MKRSAVRELLRLTARPDIISFAGGLPAPEFFPLEETRRATEAVLAEKGYAALQYGETEGLEALRDWIAERFARPGLQIGRANVLIVSGAQQALDLIGRIFLDEGDVAIVENPTYLALLSAWRPMGPRFLPIPSDCDGMRVEELKTALQQRPKLIYTIPNFQNPQGSTLNLERRARLVALAREFEAIVVEDDPYGELRFDGESIPSILELDASLDRTGVLDGNAMYVGTFSKVLMPGLRVGWVIAPEPVIDKLVQAKQAVDLHTSTFTQQIVHELVRTGVLDMQVPRLRTAYRERRDAMLSALQRHFPREVSWTRPAGGMFLMATLPEAVDAEDVLAAALRRNVAFVPGAEFHLNGIGRNTFRLNFSNAAPARIEEGVRRLAQVVKRALPSVSCNPTLTL